MKVLRNFPKPKRVSMNAHFVMTRLVQIGLFGEQDVLIPESRSWHWKTCDRPITETDIGKKGKGV